jgi:hypothetical protein
MEEQAHSKYLQDIFNQSPSRSGWGLLLPSSLGETELENLIQTEELKEFYIVMPRN